MAYIFHRGWVCVGYANADATANDHMLLTILECNGNSGFTALLVASWAIAITNGVLKCKGNSGFTASLVASWAIAITIGVLKCNGNSGFTALLVASWAIAITNGVDFDKPVNLAYDIPVPLVGGKLTANFTAGLKMCLTPANNSCVLTIGTDAEKNWFIRRKVVFEEVKA